MHLQITTLPKAGTEFLETELKEVVKQVAVWLLGDGMPLEDIALINM
jgi:hypothetical protein